MCGAFQRRGRGGEKEGCLLRNVNVTFSTRHRQEMIFLTFFLDLNRLADDDDGAAETGVKETTTKASIYPHPTNDKLKFWDLPGIGMLMYPCSF